MKKDKMQAPSYKAWNKEGLQANPLKYQSK